MYAQCLSAPTTPVSPSHGTPFHCKGVVRKKGSQPVKEGADSTQKRLVGEVLSISKDVRLRNSLKCWPCVHRKGIKIAWGDETESVEQAINLEVYVTCIP